jgi:hypothetical protein
VKELETLLLLQLVPVYVLVALVANYSSNLFNSRDGGMLNHVQECLIGELADDTCLTANNIPWPSVML